MNTKTVAVATGITVLAALGAAAIIWSSLTKQPPAAQEPAPLQTTIIGTEPTAVMALDRDGQPADGGKFDTLPIPNGVSSGIGIDIPEAQLTQPGSDLGPGSKVIANLYQPDVSANPFVILGVDEFTGPLRGMARASAFAAAGMPDEGTRIVQRVTLRLRQIGGSGSMDSWHLFASVMPVNLKLQPMTVIPIVGDDCGDALTPLAGHDGATNDTVQVCSYAFGSINAPASPISSMLIKARIGDKTQNLYIQSDADIDPELEDAHQHDHDEQWWQIDPKTGQPVIDPDTGKPVRADQHDR